MVITVFSTVKVRNSFKKSDLLIIKRLSLSVYAGKNKYGKYLIKLLN